MFTINFVNYLLPKLIVRNIHSQIIKKKELFEEKSTFFSFLYNAILCSKKKTKHLLYSIVERVCMNVNFNCISWK